MLPSVQYLGTQLSNINQSFPCPPPTPPPFCLAYIPYVPGVQREYHVLVSEGSCLVVPAGSVCIGKGCMCGCVEGEGDVCGCVEGEGDVCGFVEGEEVEMAWGRILEGRDGVWTCQGMRVHDLCFVAKSA